MKTRTTAAFTGVLFITCNCLCALSAPAVARPEYADVEVQAMVGSAELGVRMGSAPAVEASLSRAFVPDLFNRLSPEMRYKIASLYGAAEMQLGKLEIAHHAFVQATQNPNATEDDWGLRLTVATTINDSADAYDAFVHMHAHWPDFVSDLSAVDIQDIGEQFEHVKNHPEAQRVLWEALDKAGWSSPDPTQDTSLIWLPYALSLSESGRTKDALAVAKRIVDPMTIIEMRADRRFDAVIAMDPAWFDPVARGTAWLHVLQKIAVDEPQRLRAQYAPARALHNLGRDEEALAALNAVFPFTKCGCAEAKARYDDAPSEFGNAITLKGTILLALGRADEGLKMYAQNLKGGWQKNMTLDLLAASRFNMFGHPKEALAILDSPYKDDLSPYWKTTHAEIRVCTLTNMGRSGEIGADMDVLKAEKDKDPENLLIAQLCAGDEDGVAVTLIAMLHTPSQRLQALSDLQIYSDKGLAPYSAVLRGRTVDIRKRADILAAVAPVGRILKYDLPN